MTVASLRNSKGCGLRDVKGKRRRVFRSKMNKDADDEEEFDSLKWSYG